MTDTSNIPNGWAWASIEQVSQLNPKHPKAIEDNTEISFVPMASISDITGEIVASEIRTLGSVRKGYTHFCDGDVLFAKITPCMENGKSAVASGMRNGMACGSTEFFVFRPEGIVPEFLHRFLRQHSFRKEAEYQMTGAVGQQRVPRSYLESYKLPLPPLNEQRRIADKIDALQAKSRRTREALETVKPLLEKFRQSVLAAAFRGDLTAEWRKQNPNMEPASRLLERIRAERRVRWEEAELAKMQAKGVKPKNDKWKEKYEEPAPVDTEGLPELPEGWCWASTSESCAIVVDCHNKTAPYKEDGIPLIRTTNVRNGKINLSATMFVDEPTYQYWSRRCIPLPGDIIFTREAPMCEVGMIPEEVMLCMGQRMMLLRADDNNLRKNFLLYALQAPHIIEFAQRVGVGMGVKHLRVRDVENLPIPLAPIAEQKQLEIILTRTIELHEKLLEIVEGTSSPLNNLDQSILAKAFRGELVPQDPNDEPASVLLERIKAERETSNGNKATKSRQRR
ncbi:restriction endonuclease subunit S [Desulfovibrio subterraneus]|uniref:Type I restriction modification DNA specificity domain-containing protein n=1 Tax=Desulfovibrio subterraneus TaxID=2718620 RepID=A0A7J0BJ84_9BACT|nr:restriction endonuclease subunit S [Desulfovibrio subterraneus]GFM33720.1 hypothetical protein DSM101010T_20850 [Desulfovibrio subterraneus]